MAKEKIKIKCFYTREEPRVVELHDHLPFTKYKSIEHGDRPYRIEIPKEIKFRSWMYDAFIHWLYKKINIEGYGVHYE